MGLQGVYGPAPCTPVRHGSSSLKKKGVSEGKGGGAMQPTYPGYWTASSFLFNKNCYKI
ncbi:hypothetical protein DPMN_101409 [Dreissena polymorpha]|uniref:Uncharacterized protein n=1 Tax=Dreissena polymorpha TaxID=45954 RepID=A0A9D4RA19_DREPO|nr:hypothetical protein DPMN_101409 [Dreissena polymorpha]